MARNNLVDRNDRMGKALEMSFRKAVSESRKHAYVSFLDRSENNSVLILASEPGLGKSKNIIKSLSGGFSYKIQHK